MMENDKIKIKKSDVRDVSILYKIYSDKGVMKHQNRKPMNKKIQAYLFFFKHFISIYSIKIEKETVGFLFLDKRKYTYRIHFILQKKYRNQGIMKKALSLFMNQYDKAKKWEAFVNENNLAAIKVLHALKFKKEKILNTNKVNLYTGNLDKIVVYSFIAKNKNIRRR